MRHLMISLICGAMGLAAFAKPHCLGFNNYDGKVTIVFSDDEARNGYLVEEAVLVTCGKEYRADSIRSEVRAGTATVNLYFPHITRFSNPKVKLRINGRKAKLKVCR